MYNATVWVLLCTHEASIRAHTYIQRVSETIHRLSLIMTQVTHKQERGRESSSNRDVLADSYWLETISLKEKNSMRSQKIVRLSDFRVLSFFFCKFLIESWPNYKANYPSYDIRESNGNWSNTGWTRDISTPSCNFAFYELVSRPSDNFLRNITRLWNTLAFWTYPRFLPWTYITVY